MEATLSLHVLLDAKGHPLQHPWVRQARPAARLRRELRELAWVYVDGQPDCFLRRERRDRSTTASGGLRRFLAEKMPRYELARPLYHYSTRGRGAPSGCAEPGMRRTRS